MSTSTLPAVTPAVAVTPDVLAVQHNALVNARFGMDTLEMRLFLAMLGRIGRADVTFAECVIPVREIGPEGSVNVPYAEVAAMVKKLARRALDIEKLGPDGRRQKEPDIISIALMSFASYSKSEGTVVARFNDAIRPYLLQLSANFTKAEIKQLQKLKSVASHRIYWLLKEYAAFGKRTVSLAELRNVLGLTTEYEGRFDHFRARVLDRAQQELQETDLPFTYELIRQGKAVSEIRFLFAPAPAQLPRAAPAADGWEAALLAVGVAGKSLATIKTQLEAGYYDEGYIRFVLQRVGEQVRQGKVKKQAGAVYKALADGYLLTDYQKAQATPAPIAAKPRPAATTRQQEKLRSELEDARTSLKFAKSAAAGYSPEQRQQVVVEIEAKIAGLTQQLGG